MQHMHGNIPYMFDCSGCSSPPATKDLHDLTFCNEYFHSIHSNFLTLLMTIKVARMRKFFCSNNFFFKRFSFQDIIHFIMGLLDKPWCRLRLLSTQKSENMTPKKTTLVLCCWPISKCRPQTKLTSLKQIPFWSNIFVCPRWWDWHGTDYIKELFGRSRWTTGLAQQSNMYAMISCRYTSCIILGFVINTTAYGLG